MVVPRESIESQEFTVTSPGYDRDEVRAFLRKVAASAMPTDDEVEALQAAARRDRLDALREANKLLQRARTEAGELLASANEDRERIIRRLEDVRDQIRETEALLLRMLDEERTGARER